MADKKKARSPAFQFYAKDWRDVKVRRMSLAAQGAYIAILADMWVDSKDQCSILHNTSFLARALGVSVEEFEKIWHEIQGTSEPLFEELDGRLYSIRLESESMKQRKYSKEQRKRSLCRWNKETMPEVCHDDAGLMPKVFSSPSSSPSPSNKEIKSLTTTMRFEKKPVRLVQKPTRTAVIDDGKPSPTSSKSTLTWEAYRAAYNSRWNVDPVQNMQVRAMLCKLVDKVGLNAAPHVAAFYVTHNNPFYVSKRHPVNLLLQDAEGLHTQCVTGVKSTTDESRKAERTDDVVNQLARMKINSIEQRKPIDVTPQVKELQHGDSTER